MSGAALASEDGNVTAVSEVSLAAASSVHTAVIPVTLEAAQGVDFLRVAAMVVGIAALAFTFYHAIARRPNCVRR